VPRAPAGSPRARRTPEMARRWCCWGRAPSWTCSPRATRGRGVAPWPRSWTRWRPRDDGPRPAGRADRPCPSGQPEPVHRGVAGVAAGHAVAHAADAGVPGGDVRGVLRGRRAAAGGMDRPVGARASPGARVGLRRREAGAGRGAGGVRRVVVAPGAGRIARHAAGRPGGGRHAGVRRRVHGGGPVQRPAVLRRREPHRGGGAGVGRASGAAGVVQPAVRLAAPPPLRRAPGWVRRRASGSSAAPAPSSTGRSRACCRPCSCSPASPCWWTACGVWPRAEPASSVRGRCPAKTDSDLTRRQRSQRSRFQVHRGFRCRRPGRPAYRDAISRRAVASLGNGVYPHFPEDTFPAVPAREPAVTSTCRASLKGCLSTLSRTESHPSATIQLCGASAPSQDRASGVVNAGSRGAAANVTPADALAKNRDGILPRFTPSADPRLRLPACRGERCGDAGDRPTCRRPPDHRLQRNPRRTCFYRSSSLRRRGRDLGERHEKTPFTPLTPGEAILVADSV
jgi:hypothetical protein